MTCRQLRPYMVDFARGAIDAAAVEAQIARHVRGCRECTALVERERVMSAALQRVAATMTVPAADPQREAALLEMFESRLVSPAAPATSRWWLGSLAVAATVLIAVGAWRYVSSGSRVGPHVGPPEGGPHVLQSDVRLKSDPAVSDDQPTIARRTAAGQAGPRVRTLRAGAPSVLADDSELVLDATSFVTWPASSAPRFESGTLMRLDLPVSILPALGLWPPQSADSVVPVDVLVGQDGFARAFRLASE